MPAQIDPGIVRYNSTEMKQVLQNLKSGETIISKVPAPAPQAGEILVRNHASLVSAGTERMVVEFAEKSLLGKARSRPDLVRQVLDKSRREGLLTTFEAAMNRLDQPMPLGYASAGTIIDLGGDVSGFKIGQRVACAGGGYAVHAEVVSVPKNLVVPLPDSVDFDSAAFTTLGAIALHGFRLAQVQLGENLAIIGLGLLGMLAAGIGRAAGCQILGVDLDEKRVALARQLGFSAVVRDQAVEAVQAFGRGQGADAILICADTPSPDPVELAGIIARDRARVVAVGAVGLSLPRKIYFEKELTFINSRSYGPGRYDPHYEEGGQDYPIGYVRWTEGRNLQAVVDLLASGQLNVRPLITHRFPIDQAQTAYELITGKSGEPFLGVVLTYADQIPEEPLQSELALENQGGQTIQITDTSDLASPETPGAQSIHPNRSEKSSGVERVTLGVIGAGNFASAVLLPALKSIQKSTGSSSAEKGLPLDLVGIASSSGASAQHACQRFGFNYATSKADQIIHDPQVNTVAILTRHNLHAPLILEALSAGKHVFCEKPLALNETELAQIESSFREIQNNEKIAQSQPLLMVGFNRRFAPLALQMHQFVEECPEPLAIHYRVNAGYLPLQHWLHDPIQGGGRIIGEGCHFIDFITFLVGSSPTSVSAFGLPDEGRYREDIVVIQLTYSDGSLGTVSYLANGDRSLPKERVEVFCAGRVAILDDFRRLELVKEGKRRVVQSRLRQDKGHAGEWVAFIQRIRAGESPPIPYSHLFGVTRATFAALEALRSQRNIVIPSV